MACGKYFRVYAVGGFSAIGGFLFGYHTGVISGVLTMEDFKNKMHLPNDTQGHPSKSDPFDRYTSLIVGVLLAGCVFGSLIGGQTSDRFSRKYSISFFSFIFTISAVLQTASSEIIQLLIGRFFAGISIGALSMIVPVYHSEIAATQVRGRIITLQQWAITIGIAISFWFNAWTHSSSLKNKPAEWRIPLGLQAVPSLILTVGILFCPFSPRWLISHDREDEARDVLMKIRSASHDEIEEEMDRIKAEVAYLRENEIDSYRQLFRPPILRPFILGVGIQILQQLTGINATIYYAPRIFQQLSPNNVMGPLLATGVNGCVNVLATIPTIIFIDKLGRRVLLISGAVIMFLSMLVVAILDGVSNQDGKCDPTIMDCHSIFLANIIFIYVFVAAFAYSWGPVPWVYCAEIFPLTMRAKATSLTTAANWATNCALSFAVLALLQYGNYATFITFSVFCALMIGIVYLFYPETKDIHLERNDIGDVKRTLVPQWLEDRRRNYNTFHEHTVVNQTHIPIPSEENSINQMNNSNSTVHTDECLPENKSDSTDVVS